MTWSFMSPDNRVHGVFMGGRVGQTNIAGMSQGSRELHLDGSFLVSTVRRSGIEAEAALKRFVWHSSDGARRKGKGAHMIKHEPRRKLRVRLNLANVELEPCDRCEDYPDQSHRWPSRIGTSLMEASPAFWTMSCSESMVTMVTMVDELGARLPG